MTTSVNVEPLKVHPAWKHQVRLHLLDSPAQHMKQKTPRQLPSKKTQVKKSFIRKHLWGKEPSVSCYYRVIIYFQAKINQKHQCQDLLFLLHDQFFLASICPSLFITFQLSFIIKDITRELWQPPQRDVAYMSSHIAPHFHQNFLYFYATPIFFNLFKLWPSFPLTFQKPLHPACSLMPLTVTCW